MNTVRMNITLPEDVAKHLKRVRNKSAFIAESVREKLEHLEEQRLLSQLEAAYKEEAPESIEDAKAWDGATSDGIEEGEDEAWRDIYSQL